MSDAKSDYWQECIEIAAEESGAQLTLEQIKAIAWSVQSGHENYGMAFGHDVASSNRYAHLEREKQDAQKALSRERNKVHCHECEGTGRIITQGPYHSGDSQCWKCHGEGRHDP